MADAKQHAQRLCYVWEDNAEKKTQAVKMLRPGRGASPGTELQMAARSRVGAFAGRGKRILAKEREWMNMMPEMMRVWAGTEQSVKKSFGDGWVREAANLCPQGAEINPRHPMGLIGELVSQGLKPKASGQRCQSRVD